MAKTHMAKTKGTQKKSKTREVQTITAKDVGTVDLGFGTEPSREKSVDTEKPDTEKPVDTPNTNPVGSGSVIEPTEPNTKGLTTMTLTFKGLSKSGKYALYSGLRTISRLSVTNFPDQKPPATLEINGELAGPRVKLTPEERKAARKNAPKPTLAEKIAKRRAQLEKLEKQAETAEGQPVAF